MIRKEDAAAEKAFQRELLNFSHDRLYKPKSNRPDLGKPGMKQYLSFLRDLHRYVTINRHTEDEHLYRKLVKCWNISDSNIKARCQKHTVCAVCSWKHAYSRIYKLNIDNAACGKGITWISILLTIPQGKGHEDMERLRFLEISLSDLFKKISKKKGKISRAIKFCSAKIDLSKRTKSAHFNSHIHLLVQAAWDKNDASSISEWFRDRWENLTCATKVDSQIVTAKEGERIRNGVFRAARYHGHRMDIDNLEDILAAERMIYRKKLHRKYGTVVTRDNKREVLA